MDINEGWAGTCRILFGDEVGPLEGYSSYLEKYVEPPAISKSVLSGKEIAVSSEYGYGSRFISGQEAGEYSRIMGKPLDINDIKDLDSLVCALGERICYSGNNILGNSRQASFSNRVVDSHCVHKAHEVFYSKYVAYCYLVRYSERVFGAESVGHSGFVIKGFDIWQAKRILDCVHVYHASDCTYSANLENCQSCMFSFNLRSKRRCIGNIELPQDRFDALREKLLGEMRQTLGQKRSLPHMNEIVGGADG